VVGSSSFDFGNFGFGGRIGWISPGDPGPCLVYHATYDAKGRISIDDSELGMSPGEDRWRYSVTFVIIDLSLQRVKYHNEAYVDRVFLPEMRLRRSQVFYESFPSRDEGSISGTWFGE